MSHLITAVRSLLTDPRHTVLIAPCLIFADAALCALIVFKVAYTEIDWATYMTQVSKFLPPQNERRYDRIDGPTGPCVYPAMHLYIHSALYYVTDHGQDIQLAQIIYAGLYLATLALVMASYRRAAAPPWLLVLLLLSKRMHSIFLLRMFNDCWATFFLWLAIYSGARKMWTLMTLSWAIGLGVKMTMLLPLPAVAVILLQGPGIRTTLICAGLVLAVTLGIAIPFMTNDLFAIYIKQAFDLGRQFLFKWTVNWRFIGDEAFLSKPFAFSLLATHVILLLGFLHARWVRPSSVGLLDFVSIQLRALRSSSSQRVSVPERMTPRFVMDVMLAAIVIGLLCARSLHYQFFSYIGWATPYILWRSSAHPWLVVFIWAYQEWAWLVYPSTESSSAVVVGILLLQVICSWLSTPSSWSKVAEKKVQ